MIHQNYINIIIKYIIIVGLLYLILKKIPYNQISNKDIVLIITIIFISFISIDYLFIKNNDLIFNNKNITSVANNDFINNNDLINNNNLLNNDPIFDNSYNLCNNQNDNLNYKLINNNKIEKFTNDNTLCNDSSNPLCNLSSDQVLQYMYKILSDKKIQPSTSQEQEPIKQQQEQEPIKQQQEQQLIKKQVIDIKKYPIPLIQQYLNNLNNSNIDINNSSYENIIEQVNNLKYDSLNQLYLYIDTLNKTPTLKIFIKYVNQLLINKLETLNNTSIEKSIEDTNIKPIEESNNKPVQNSNNINPDIASKYIEILISDLVTNNIINEDDVSNIQNKLKSKLVSIEDVIASLEKLKDYSKINNSNKNNDLKYNELPSEFLKPIGNGIANDWGNDYTILNTDKWTVPMQRPPLCINTNPCKVCPNDTNYPVNLKSWDDSRVITKTNINKNWILNQ
jgi:hypothetical protein